MPTKVKLILGVMVLVAAVLMVYVYDNGVSGSNSTSLSKPAYVRQLIPTSGSNVLRQSTIGVNLATGYDAYLVVNGVKITNVASKEHPDGLLKAPTLGTIEYHPGPGRRIRRLTSPEQCVDAFVYKTEDGPGTAQQINWCFKVT
ncbi:MAG: hypothetical protein R2698_14315 [Microthrixaceae bacterium]